MSKSSTPNRRQRQGTKDLLEDCLVLLTSLALTEPRMTERQTDKLPKLIRRLKKELESEHHRHA